MPTTLYQIGKLTMSSPMGLNPQDVAEEFGADFAVKPIVGAIQDREFVGQADTRLNLTGRIFPYRFAAAGGSSGLTELDMLRTMASSGEPQVVMRGDGVNLGFYLIERAGVRHVNLSKSGIGREQQFTISMVKSKQGPNSQTLTNLFTGLITDFTSSLGFGQ